LSGLESSKLDRARAAFRAVDPFCSGVDSFELEAYIHVEPVADVCLHRVRCQWAADAAESSQLRVGTFDIDATPPIGSMMAYDR